MKEIKEFMLPEHTNSLYKNEAISSIALTKEVAEKINELVNAYNELSKEDLTHKQEQDGKIAKAVLYMKDNLINSLQELMDVLVENGFIDTRIKSYCGDLNRRLDNLLGSIKKGSTTSSMDAEVIDGRTGILSDDYKSLGEAIRGELKHVLMAHSGGTTFKNETIVAETGGIHPNDTRLLSSLISLTHYQSLTCDTLYQIRLFYYDAELNYVGSSDWGRNFDLTSIDKNVLFIRFVVAKRTNDLITIDDLEAIKMDLTKRNNGSGTGGTGVKYQISNMELFNGTITNSGSFDYRTNRLITRIVKADFTKIEVKDGYKLKIACYDANMQALTGNDFKSGYLTPSDLLDGTEYMHVIVGNTNDSNELTPSDDTGLTIHSDLDLFADYNKKAPAFIHELMNTAYSSINLGIANSKMHFDLSARFGFNALKGDVRISSDDKLFMWHDAGITASSGMIYPYNANSNMKVIDLNSNTLGAYTHFESLSYLPVASQHLCTFEEYIQICVKHNKIAYITVRENKIPKVIELCMETLKKYNMLERCVFNSYEYEALQTVRKYSPTIPVSLVLKHEVAVAKGDIERVACLGNAILTLFYAPSENIDTLLTSSTELFEYAKERNVILHMAQVDKYVDYIKCINAGFKGFHLLKPLQEHCVKYTLKIKWNGNNVELLNDDLTADIEVYENEIYISNVKKINSSLEYDDGFPLFLLMRKNPILFVSSITWKTDNTKIPYAYYESAESSLIVNTHDFNQNFNITMIL